jgi:hypothetical protein
MTTLLHEQDHERLQLAWTQLEQAAEDSARRSRERRAAGHGVRARVARLVARLRQPRSAMR